MVKSKFSVHQHEAVKFLCALPDDVSITYACHCERFIPDLQLTLEGDADPDAPVVYRAFDQSYETNEGGIIKVIRTMRFVPSQR